MEFGSKAAGWLGFRGQPPLQLGKGQVLHLQASRGERRDADDFDAGRLVDGGYPHLLAELREFEKHPARRFAFAGHGGQALKATMPPASN